MLYVVRKAVSFVQDSKHGDSCNSILTSASILSEKALRKNFRNWYNEPGVR